MTTSSPTTVVLVHGAWHGSWCWHNVVSELDRLGVDAIAVELPGHGTPGSSKRKWNTMSSYVDHVQSVVESIDGEVVLVGHSMGGLVVQRALETRLVKAAVLVASIPRRGATGALIRLAQSHPTRVLETLSLSLWPLVATDDLVREHFFQSNTDTAIVEHAGSKMQNESYPAFLSMLLRRPRPWRVSGLGTPIPVVAAAHDAIFTLDEQRDLATAYGADLEVIDCAHDIMLETRWPELAAHIAEVAGAS